MEENVSTEPMRFPADLKAVLARAQEIAREVAAPRAEETDRKKRWPAEAIRALQRSGLAGLVVPEEAGGLGFGMGAVAQVCEVLGRECASTALCFGMHCVATAVIASKATAWQRQEYLVPIAEGRHLTSLALSEPGTGIHFYLPQTSLAAVDHDTYLVNGTKSFVTSGGHADSYVISTVAADPSAPPGEFSCVVIPAETPGLSWHGEWTGMGMRGNSSRMAELRDVRVPRSNLLGEEGDQIWYVFQIVAPYFLMAMAGTYLGVASSALDEGLNHLRRRTYTHSGHLLGQSAVLQHRLGCLWSMVERARRLLYHAGMEGDTGGPNALLAVMSAKADVADCAVQVVNEVMTLTGAIGYAKEGRLERLLRDVRAAHVMAPTTDILRTWAGRTLLGLPLLGD